MELEKTLKINTLFDFYGPLLTKKQQNYMKLYYYDDYSLGEIAENFDVSRQAVYDNIKRSETALKDYEEILHLAHDFKARNQQIKKMKDYIEDHYQSDKQLIGFIDELIAMVDDREEN